MKNRVVIVTAGQWGAATKEDYAFWVDLLKERLEGENVRRRKAQVREFEVELAESADDGLAKLKDRGGRFLVFLSRSETEQAEQIANENHHIRVFVLTGLIPPGKVVYLEKSWLGANPELTESMFSTTPLI